MTGGVIGPLVVVVATCGDDDGGGVIGIPKIPPSNLVYKSFSSSKLFAVGDVVVRRMLPSPKSHVGSVEVVVGPGILLLLLDLLVTR